MQDTFFVISILLVTIVAPIWITFHYITKWRSQKTLTGEDENILQELYENAAKMEDRIHHLERILDEEAAGWRRKSDDA